LSPTGFPEIFTTFPPGVQPDFSELNINL
jgi:hypothetical protein